MQTDRWTDTTTHLPVLSPVGAAGGAEREPPQTLPAGPPTHHRVPAQHQPLQHTATRDTQAPCWGLGYTHMEGGTGVHVQQMLPIHHWTGGTGVTASTAHAPSSIHPLAMACIQSHPPELFHQTRPPAHRGCHSSLPPARVPSSRPPCCPGPAPPPSPSSPACGSQTSTCLWNRGAENEY